MIPGRTPAPTRMTPMVDQASLDQPWTSTQTSHLIDEMANSTDEMANSIRGSMDPPLANILLAPEVEPHAWFEARGPVGRPPFTGGREEHHLLRSAKMNERSETPLPLFIANHSYAEMIEVPSQRRGP